MLTVRNSGHRQGALVDGRRAFPVVGLNTVAKSTVGVGVIAPRGGGIASSAGSVEFAGDFGGQRADSELSRQGLAGLASCEGQAKASKAGKKQETFHNRLVWLGWLVLVGNSDCLKDGLDNGVGDFSNLDLSARTGDGNSNWAAIVDEAFEARGGEARSAIRGNPLLCPHLPLFKLRRCGGNNDIAGDSGRRVASWDRDGGINL